MCRGSSWRTRDVLLFQEAEGFFLQGSFTPYAFEQKTSVNASIKPMGVDPVLWRLAGMPENEDAPLSFRANGVFTCRGLPVREEVFDDTDRSPAESAEAIVSFMDSAAEKALDLTKSSRFSDLLDRFMADRPRHRLIATYVTSLILEGRLEDAMAVARRHQSDPGADGMILLGSPASGLPTFCAVALYALERGFR